MNENEPCRMCGHLPILANYYDFYRFHCPTPGCREHMGEWKVVNGKGVWYGSIDDARDAWNTRQKRGEATSAPETAEPEPEPASAENRPQNGLEQSDSGTAEAETSQVPELDADGTCPNGIGQASIDTREKLEADVRSSLGFTTKDVFGWLDRQAAITKDEWCNDRGWWNTAHEADCAIALCHEKDEQIAELTTKCDEAYRRGYDDGLHANTRAAFAAAEQAFGDESAMRFEGGVIKSQAQRIRELEAERDELKAFAERLETAAHDKLGVTLFGVDYVTEEFMLHVRDALTDERDHLRNVVKQQADSFAKLERELHDLNSGEALNALRASVAGLKGTVEKQRERIGLLENENRELNIQLHGAPF